MPNAKRKTEPAAPRRSRIGGAVGSWPDAKPATEPAPLKAKARKPKAEDAAPRPASVPEGRRKARATWDLPAELLDGCRDAVVFLAGPPLHLTMGALVDGALRRELDRLAREHNKGKAFPKRGAPVRMGRPIPR